MEPDISEPEPSLSEKIKRKVIGSPRDVNEPSIFHKLSLIPILAWIGLGADGLSSSSYGPEEAFRTLGSHTYLAIFIALATALTVVIISYSYTRIIEHFPHGGGGYIVATHTISKDAGVISGCALLVDYMLTITVSLVSCGDAIFSFLPLPFQKYKLIFVGFLIVLLVILNLRGVKESVTLLAPIFVIFIITHILLIGSGIFSHIGEVKPLVTEMKGSSITALVIMYSINVFLTFSLSQFGMARFFVKNRDIDKNWKRHIVIHIIGLILCLTILTVTVYEKFGEGGWVTLLITSMVIVLCYLIRAHYKKVKVAMRKLGEVLSDIPPFATFNHEPVNQNDMTAILLVSGFNGFGLHTLLSIVRYFPNVYKNFLFLSVAEVDSGSFKGIAEIEALKESVKKDLLKYVKITRQHGFPADFRTNVGTDVVENASDLVESTVKEFPRSTVFTGKLVFRQEHPFQKILHNETANAIQRRLQWNGIATVILPIRVDI